MREAGAFRLEGAKAHASSDSSTEICQDSTQLSGRHLLGSFHHVRTIQDDPRWREGAWGSSPRSFRLFSYTRLMTSTTSRSPLQLIIHSMHQVGPVIRIKDTGFLKWMAH